ncbi:MAG TPA: response regulator [Tepidisphaeraceae bacterium]|jgi:response regulator of citrate/malate metabolism
MAPKTIIPAPMTTHRPRVLVVDDEPMLIEMVGDLVGRNISCNLISAANIHEARHILETQPIELLVTDVNLPDGDGMSLLPTLRRQSPNASAIVITGSPTVDGAINALRHGALDFMPKPFTAENLVDRVRKALERQEKIARNDKRMTRLRDAVKRLNEARKVVSKKVDILCNDLITAYGELSKQLDSVRTQEGFRKYLSQAKDLEQLLCHTMDWMLRQLGYSNVAIWLAAEDAEFQLGAYMKYTIAGEEDLTNAMKGGIIPLAIRDGAVHLGTEQVQQQLTAPELDYLADQEMLAVNCTYLGESLAVVVLFRDHNTPFTDEDFAMLKSISPIFAVALAEIVRTTQKYETDENPFYDGAGGDGGGLADRDEDGDRRDVADWWKRGEQPPF